MGRLYDCSRISASIGFGGANSNGVFRAREMMSTFATEALATLQEAERLLATLAPDSSDREAAVLLVADLRDICGDLADPGPALGSNLARAREVVYGAQAHLRILRSHAERSGAH